MENLFYKKKGVMRLFLNECMIPERVLIDWALLTRRLRKDHPARSEIEDDFHSRMAGYRGEKSLDYYLKKFPESQFDVIHQLRLNNGEYYFQMDDLLISPSGLFVLEVKNYSGDLHFDEKFDQFFRIFPNKGKKERFQNPVIQAREQAVQLKKWLAQHHQANLPIEYLFVNANNKSIITADSRNQQILERVTNSETLIDKIYQILKTYEPKNIKRSTLNNIETLLLASHTPQDLQLEKMYHITPDEIITGIHCPNCFAIPMNYKHGIWYCHRCNYQSKTAYVDTVYDYFLLIKPTITNSELRRFLQISSPDVAMNHLQSMNLSFTGVHKGRIYYRPALISFTQSNILLNGANFPLNNAPLIK